MKDGKFRVGIIGTGWIAIAHVQNYRKIPEVEIVALADIEEGIVEEFVEENNMDPSIHLYHSGYELIDAEYENLDAVSICTYNTEHANNTIYALEHGIPVLLEKPLCVTTEEAVAICQAEKKSGKIVSVGFQPRFDPNMQLIKKIVDSGVLGDIYYIQTGGGRRRGIPGGTFIRKETGGIGALADIGCYSLDMVLRAIGYPKPKTVTGYMSNFFGTDPAKFEYADRFTVEDDFAAAFIRLEGDIILDFRIAWAMHVDTPGDTIIFGKDGALRIPSTQCWNGTVGGPMILYHDIDGVPSQTEIPVFPRHEDKNHNFYLKLKYFVDAVKNGGPAPVPTSEIFLNQVIIDSIVKSARLGREIEVEIPEI